MEFVKVSQEWMAGRGLLPCPYMRKNKAGTEFLLHADFFERMGGAPGVERYAHNSPELEALLSSDDWASEETPTATEGYAMATAVRNLMTATKAGIQSMKLSAAEALRLPDMYPDWSAGIDVKVGERYNYGGKLWEVVQAHTTQAGWEPGTATLALWKKVDAEGNAGTREDPIPYEQGMALELGKYYTQYGVVYECIQASGALVYDLKDAPALARPVG